MVLNYALTHQLINEERSPYLDNFQIHNYNFIVGPHLVNNNHWLALIISLKHRQFLLLDPLNLECPLTGKAFQNWLKYYYTRKDCDQEEWKINKIKHPLQTDNHSCGVFVINFIKNFIMFSCIKFDPTELFLLTERTIIASCIESCCEKVFN